MITFFGLLYHFDESKFLTNNKIYLYFYFAMKKFLWWGMSFYLSMSLHTVVFAQSNLSSVTFNQPLKYKIDFIDPRFHLTKEQFMQIGQEAAEIWQKETGKTYFL